jgi:hypothetical protein
VEDWVINRTRQAEDYVDEMAKDIGCIRLNAREHDIRPTVEGQRLGERIFGSAFQRQ